MSRRLFILGSTGSIGTSALEVVKHLQRLDSVEAWQVVGLGAGTNVDLLTQQMENFDVSAVAIADGKAPHAEHQYTGASASVELIRNHAKSGDLVLASIVGFAGVAPVLAAIEMGCDIALANKEVLVAAGEMVMSAARRNGVRILPVDSEHSAIFQCLGGTSMKGVKTIVLTASGGPLRGVSIEDIENATPSEVLDHPTWEMGPKVTVDSASLMNKALEIIEAHWLFGASSEQIEAVIHPQSIVHGLVEFDDGSIAAQLAPPDMKIPIQLALTWPNRRTSDNPACQWATLNSLEFHPIDPVRFPAILLSKEVISTGGTSGAIINAANEVAVEGFLADSLPFGSIVRIVEKTLGAVQSFQASSLEAVCAADQEARSVAKQHVAALAGKKFV